VRRQTDSNAVLRVPLSRERILRAALELVDDGGIESLTMRKLGQALGFEAMSLYNHVANKNDVVDGILDLVLSETEPPSATEDWGTAIRASAISVHQALRRHHWASSLLMSPDHIRPARLQYMDSLLGRLREAGFSADTTYHAYHILDAHILGFSLWQAGHSFKAADLPDLAADFIRRFPLDDYPHIAEHFEQHMTEGDHQHVSAFEFSLDLILDGLEKLHDTA
jgi:AcrR family transcriptional regulator